jgi:hypothetical protein
MALRPNFDYQAWDISFFCNDSTADRGGPITLSTAGSGDAMDQSAAVATYSAAPSGTVPLGVLMQDVVNVDLAKYKLNEHKNEVNTGGKVSILVQGLVETNRIYTGQTPTAGQAAYVAPSGYFSNVNASDTAPQIGRFLSTKDEDGYCKVRFDFRATN